MAIIVKNTYLYKYKLACLSRTVENTYFYKYKSACLSRTVKNTYLFKYKLACLSRTVENTYLYKYKSACLSRTVERSIRTGSQPRNRKQTANAWIKNIKNTKSIIRNSHIQTEAVNWWVLQRNSTRSLIGEK